MNKPNYVVKSYILSERKDLIENVRTISKSKYISYKGIDTGRFLGPCSDLDYCLNLEQQLITENEYLYNEALKINKADLNRNVRLKNRISKYLSLGNCLFLTLTFDDSVLNNTSEDTRRQYVRKWLKKYSSYYIANIDYGSKNEREHYHAIILYDRINSNEWPYGFSSVKPIRSTSDYKALAKYINKLTNHAIKKTCKRKALIYGELN